MNKAGTVKEEEELFPKVRDIEAAAKKLREIVKHTPLVFNQALSERYNCNVFLKREDLQVVRSYKIRGAYNTISALPLSQMKKGVVCASAGNHAQGVAYSCNKLKINGVIYMPSITPKQKIKQVEMFSGSFVKVVLKGDTFDSCMVEAIKYTRAKG